MNARIYDHNSADYRDALNVEYERSREINAGLSMRSSDTRRPSTLSGQATSPEKPVAGNVAHSSDILSGGVEKQTRATSEGSYGYDPLQREATGVTEREHVNKASEASGSSAPPAQKTLPVSATGNDSTASVPAQAEEELSQWFDERNRLQDAHDAEERAWAAQRQLQDETDNT